MKSSKNSSVRNPVYWIEINKKSSIGKTRNQIQPKPPKNLLCIQKKAEDKLRKTPDLNVSAGEISELISNLLLYQINSDL